SFTVSNDPLEDVGLSPSDLQSWEETFPMSPTEINSLQEALLVGAATTRGRQSSLMSITSDIANNNNNNNTTTLENDSGIGSEGTSAPSSGNGSHVLDTTMQGLNPTLISTLSLKDGARATRARQPFQADYPHKLHITSMEHGLMDQLAIRLLESIFFDNRQVLICFHSTLSIIMDAATMSLFPDHTLNTQAGSWRLISIGDGPLGFDECGMVSDYSRPLSENEIGLFYLSTFSSDYIMVNDQDFERAVSCLEEAAKEAAAVAAAAAASSLSSSLSSLSHHDAKSVRSIDTASLSGAGSDVEAAELSPVSTTSDSASDVKDDDDEGGEAAAAVVDEVAA
ncbi:GATS protein-like 3, partial [Modicella reniformis]